MTDDTKKFVQSKFANLIIVAIGVVADIIARIIQQ